jgi:hypothetical protein
MGVAPRQTFQGSDDILLLTHISQSPPWQHRGGVMEAWQHIAQTLNGDAACSLANLNASASRARFFRMVGQRRARQDKMLRRGTTNERQYEQKLQLLDALIARMDKFDEEVSLQNLLRDVDEDADAETSGHALPLPAPMIVQVPQPQSHSVQRKQCPYKQQRTAVTSRPQEVRDAGQGKNPLAPIARPVHRPPAPVSSVGKSTSHTMTTPPQGRREQRVPVTQPVPAAAVIPVDSPEYNLSMATRPRPAQNAPPAKKKKPSASPQDLALSLSSFPSGGDGWERLADRVLEFMQRKLELDRDAADRDRAWRRDEARDRQNDLKAMREQTDRLIHAVLELAKSK